MLRNANLWRLILSCSLNLCALLKLASAADVAQAPAPTGLYRVGTREIYLTDAARRDSFLNNGVARELGVRFWYPASGAPVCRIAPYTSQQVWSYLAELTALSLPPVRTNSCQDAQILRGPHPVVVFSHGYTGMFTDATYLFEDLASRGYVIASVAHTYESTAVELNNGRIGKSVFGSYLVPASIRSDLDSLTRAFSIRLVDLKFVLHELERLNTAGNSPFVGSFDLSRVAVMGHSLGGVAALASLEQQPSIGAAVAIDPIFPNPPLKATTRPVLILAAGRERWSRQECNLWGRLRGPRLAVNLKGADHFAPSDTTWLLGQIGIDESADMDEVAKTVATIREYVAAFLDANVLGRPPRLLLKYRPPNLMNLAITTATQNLCSDSGAD